MTGADATTVSGGLRPLLASTFQSTSMNRLAAALLTSLLLTPHLGAQEIPLRYRALSSTPRFRLVEVLGTPELPPYGLHSLSADGKFAFFANVGIGLTDEEANSVLTL